MQNLGYVLVSAQDEAHVEVLVAEHLVCADLLRVALVVRLMVVVLLVVRLMVMIDGHLVVLGLR